MLRQRSRWTTKQGNPLAIFKPYSIIEYECSYSNLKGAVSYHMNHEFAKISKESKGNVILLGWPTVLVNLTCLQFQAFTFLKKNKKNRWLLHQRLVIAWYLDFHARNMWWDLTQFIEIRIQVRSRSTPLLNHAQSWWVQNLTFII